MAAIDLRLGVAPSLTRPEYRPPSPAERAGLARPRYRVSYAPPAMSQLKPRRMPVLRRTFDATPSPWARNEIISTEKPWAASILVRLKHAHRLASIP